MPIGNKVQLENRGVSYLEIFLTLRFVGPFGKQRWFHMKQDVLYQNIFPCLQFSLNISSFSYFTRDFYVSMNSSSFYLSQLSVMRYHLALC